MKSVAVIGAGITGITTAYYLAREGYRVTVFEQEPHAAMRTSYANGGQISVSNSEVWTTWANVKKGFKWMFTKGAPLLIRPRLDLAQWKWITKFLYHTAKGDYKKNTEATIQMGIESRNLYAEIIREEGLKFDQTASGILHFYKDAAYFDSAKQAKEIYNKNGLDWDILGPMQTKAMDPALDKVDGIVGGAWTSTDWTGDIHKFCHELEKVLVSKYNVEFNYNSSVVGKYGMEYLSVVFDNVVVCAGVGSVAIGKEVGDTIDIYPVKGYSITINNVDPQHLPHVSLLDDQAKIVTASLGNRFRVAGTAELDGENYDIRKDRIDPLLSWVRTNFPNINTHDYTSWACLRPMTPSMMPIVKQSNKVINVFYNTGHGHLGWTLGPVTAKAVTKMITSKL
jgi:D-amino-acid dehydrogenase